MEFLNTPFIQEYGLPGILFVIVFLLFLYMRGEANTQRKRADESDKREEDARKQLTTVFKQEINELKEDLLKEKTATLETNKQWQQYKLEAERKIHELSERVGKFSNELGETKHLLVAERMAYGELEIFSQKIQDMNDKLVEDNAAGKTLIENMRAEMLKLEERIKMLEEEAARLREEAIQLKAEADRRAQESESRELRIQELTARIATQEFNSHQPPPAVNVVTPPDNNEGEAAA